MEQYRDLNQLIADGGVSAAMTAAQNSDTSTT